MVKKHLIGTVIVYMEKTDSDILGLGITSSLMWISNVWSRVSKEATLLSKNIGSDCSVHDKIPTRYIGLRFRLDVFSECVDAKEATLRVKKHLIGQTVIVPYMDVLMPTTIY